MGREGWEGSEVSEMVGRGKGQNELIFGEEHENERRKRSQNDLWHYLLTGVS